MQAKEDDHGAGQAAQDRQPLDQELARGAGRRAQRHEHQREAEDEGQRRHHDAAAGRRGLGVARALVPRSSSSDRPDTYDR